MHDEILHNLAERQAAILAQSESIFARANDEGRDLSDDEAGEIDAGRLEFDRLEGLAQRRQALLAQTETVTARSTSTGRRTSPEPVGHRDPDGETSRAWQARREGRGFFARTFGDVPADTGGFDSLRHFTGAVLNLRADPRLERFRAAGQSGNTGVDGGFAVPTAWARELWDDVAGASVVLPRARVRSMEAGSVLSYGFDGLDRSADTVFGFAAEWLAEGATGALQTGKLRSVKMAAKKLGLWTKITSELLEDAGLFETDLRGAMSKATAWNLDRAFIAGSGVGQPTGIRNALSKIVVAKEAGPQAADTIVYPNVVKMYSRMWPMGHANSVWLANASTLPQLLQMQNIVVDPTAGIVGGTPAMRQEGEAFFLLGRPLIISEHLPLLGDEDDLMFVDLSQYAVGLRRAIRIETSLSAHWQTDEMGLRLTTRAAGIALWDEPSTPPNGATQSWAISLAERA